MEADHDVGHLNAGIVDVVLYFYRCDPPAQHAHESVAQNRISQMADMRGFVGINIGVLDDDFAALCFLAFVAMQKERKHRDQDGC